MKSNTREIIRAHGGQQQEDGGGYTAAPRQLKGTLTRMWLPCMGPHVPQGEGTGQLENVLTCLQTSSVLSLARGLSGVLSNSLSSSASCLPGPQK